VEQVVARHDDAGTLGEVASRSKLEAREVEARVGEGRRPPVEIDHERARVDARAGLVPLPRAVGLDPGDEDAARTASSRSPRRRVPARSRPTPHFGRPVRTITGRTARSAGSRSSPSPSAGRGRAAPISGRSRSAAGVPPAPVASTEHVMPDAVSVGHQELGGVGVVLDHEHAWSGRTRRRSRLAGPS
jgi:hypothetical protein